MKISRNLSNLCRLLKEQLNWEADPYTFNRTYASRSLLMGGAFSWVIYAKNENGHRFLVGSCYPLKDYARKDTIVDFSLSWGDTEIYPYTPEEYQRVIAKRGDTE